MSRGQDHLDYPPDMREWQKPLYDFLRDTRDVRRTLRSLVVKFIRAKIPYAVVGGLAVNAHGVRNISNDVDVLLTGEMFARFQERIAEGNYDPELGRKRRFRDRVTGVAIDFAITGIRPGWFRPSLWAYPDPESVIETIDGVSYVKLRTLVELKLATGRYRDLADAAGLIAVHHLDETYTHQLDPCLHPLFIHCLKEVRRQVDFDAQQ